RPAYGNADAASLVTAHRVYYHHDTGNATPIGLSSVRQGPAHHHAFLGGTPMATVTELHVNGSKHRIDADPARSLLSVLRDDLDLTGSKYGCGEGRCGACTVTIEGQPTHSCITRVGAVGDKPIRTIEGVADGDKLHPLQEAFLEAGAMQCGYCTPGMIMSALALL